LLTISIANIRKNWVAAVTSNTFIGYQLFAYQLIAKKSK
jgi:hypothetical protein